MYLPPRQWTRSGGRIGTQFGFAVQNLVNAFLSYYHEHKIGRRGADLKTEAPLIKLVDSETGEQIAAAVDRENLGEGAMVGSVNFSREEKQRAAAEAFDGWAGRLRLFLNSAHELSAEDIKRVEATNFPYAGAGSARK